MSLKKIIFQADRYLVEIEEKGTKILEEIDVDEKQDVEIFRVPSHNNVSGADFYHDFKKVSYLCEQSQFLSVEKKKRWKVEHNLHFQGNK